MAASKKTPPVARKLPAAKGDKQAPVANTQGKVLKDIQVKDMSPEAISQRRSEAQKAATRMVRTSTAEVRAADIKVVTAKAGQETVYDTLKQVWSAKGEIVTKVAGVMVEVSKADLVRQLKQLPRDAKTPFKVSASETDSLVHILA